MKPGCGDKGDSIIVINLHDKLIGHLFDSLEGSNYTCDAGPLKNDLSYIVLKQLLYERLGEQIPKHLIEKYDRNPHLRDNGDAPKFGYSHQPNQRNNTQEGTTSAASIAAKLSIELSELKKLRSNAESIKDAIIIKERLLNELRAYLDRKNKEVN